MARRGARPARPRRHRACAVLPVRRSCRRRVRPRRPLGRGARSFDGRRDRHGCRLRPPGVDRRADPPGSRDRHAVGRRRGHPLAARRLPAADHGRATRRGEPAVGPRRRRGQGGGVAFRPAGDGRGDHSGELAVDAAGGGRGPGGADGDHRVGPGHGRVAPGDHRPMAGGGQSADLLRDDSGFEPLGTSGLRCLRNLSQDPDGGPGPAAYASVSERSRSGAMRTERDSMGEVAVPDDAYYGASTQRAVDNFPISDLRFGRRLIQALGMIKSAAASVNSVSGLVPADKAEAIVTASEEVVVGVHDAQFVVDLFQTGSGTSSNMNANEVIANRATELLGGVRGSKLVHPNDHVNAGQSSNDVIPTAIHVAAVAALREDTIPALDRLATALAAKATEFDHIIKSGRTHLMDATPIRLGQEFGGYAAQVRKGADRLEKVLPELEELALGGTAVGTGINAHPGFAADVIALVAKRTGSPFREADNHFEAQAAKDAAGAASGALKTVAVSLFKVANDIRWLSSGPRTAIGEIKLPENQPGSSIMPGKVNPVMAESVMPVLAHNLI